MFGSWSFDIEILIAHFFQEAAFRTGRQHSTAIGTVWCDNSTSEMFNSLHGLLRSRSLRIDDLTAGPIAIGQHVNTESRCGCEGHCTTSKPTNIGLTLSNIFAHEEWCERSACSSFRFFVTGDLLGEVIKQWFSYEGQ